MIVTLEREEDEINPTVRKISKKWEDQPCHHEESSGQPCNQETLSFPTLSSRKTQLISVIKKDRCQPCKITKIKKERKHQVKSLIKPYHQEEKWEEPYH